MHRIAAFFLGTELCDQAEKSFPTRCALHCGILSRYRLCNRIGDDLLLYSRAGHPSANRFIGLMTFLLWVLVCNRVGNSHLPYSRAGHPSANRFIGLMTFLLWVPVCIKKDADIKYLPLALLKIQLCHRRS